MRSTQDGFFAKTEIIKVELVVILILSIVIYLLAGYYNLMERVVDFSRHHEHWQMDEFITVSVFLVLALAIFSIRRWREVVASEIILIQSNKDLQKALSEIKQLKGIVPICSACKSVRDDKGFWKQVEVYIRDHTEAEFSHGICPDCMIKLYPEYVKKNEARIGSD